MLLYILKLESDKYYVGTTNKISNRIEDHISDIGSEWTKKYKFIEVVNVFEIDDLYDENKHTLKMMSKYGIDNVRGGSFTTIDLNDTQKKLITEMIYGAENKCFNCGSKDHFAKKCHMKGNTNRCYKCGRQGHYANQCYTKKDTYVNNVLNYKYDQYATRENAMNCIIL